jgi:hypothetical protein
LVDAEEAGAMVHSRLEMVKHPSRHTGKARGRTRLAADAGIERFLGCDVRVNASWAICTLTSYHWGERT